MALGDCNHKEQEEDAALNQVKKSQHQLVKEKKNHSLNL